jgi:hypothetical protein
MFRYKHGTNPSSWDETKWIGTVTPVTQVKWYLSTTAMCAFEFQNNILHAWNVGRVMITNKKQQFLHFTQASSTVNPHYNTT